MTNQDSSPHPIDRKILSLDFFDLQTLIAVAESGSFRGASVDLGIGQSAVSRRIQKFEDTIGVSLFERRTTGARLTNAGRCFVSRANEIFNELSVAVGGIQVAGTGGCGVLRIGLAASSSQVAVRRVLGTFSKTHQDVELRFWESDLHDLLTGLSHRRLDVMIAVGEPQPVGSESLPLVYETAFLAMPSDHHLSGARHLKWTDLAKDLLLVGADGSDAHFHEYVAASTNELSAEMRVERHRCGHEGIMQLVSFGVGVSVVPGHRHQERHFDVSFVPIGEDAIKVPYSIAWRPENDNPALRRFISLAQIEAKRNGALS